MSESIYGEGWRAATGWEDLSTALAEDFLVRDSDGDKVVAVNGDSGFYTWIDSVGETRTQRTNDPEKMRIKDAAEPTPLSSDDLQETLASLRGGKVEWGVRDNATIAGDVTGGFTDRADCEDWIRRNPLNFGPADFDVVTRIVTPWTKA